VQQYRPELAKSLNLEPPAVSQEPRADSARRINGLSIDEPTKAVYQAMAERPGAMEFVKDLMAKRYMIVPPAAGVLDTTKERWTPSPNVANGAQPETMEISGVQWTKVPNAQGLPTWQRAPEADSAVADWIKAHPQQVAGLDPQVARDLARKEIDKRKVTTRVEVTQAVAHARRGGPRRGLREPDGPAAAGLGASANPRLRAADPRSRRRAGETGRRGHGARATAGEFQGQPGELTRLQTQRAPRAGLRGDGGKEPDYALQLSAQVDRTADPLHSNQVLQSRPVELDGATEMANFARAVRTAINEYARSRFHQRRPPPLPSVQSMTGRTLHALRRA